MRNSSFFMELLFRDQITTPECIAHSGNSDNHICASQIFKNMQRISDFLAKYMERKNDALKK